MNATINIKSNQTSLLIISLLLILTACNNNNNLADAYGNFEADQTLVSAETAGKILDLNITEGQVLNANQTVALIDTVLPTLQLMEIKAQYNRIKANLANIDAQAAVVTQQKSNLQTDLQRIENMKESGAATQKQYDDITGGIKVMEKQIEAFAAQKNSINQELAIINSKQQLIIEQLNKCKVTNPVKGTVIEKYAEKGEITAPGKPLYKLANLENIILKAYVSGSQLHDVSLGSPCKVYIDKNKTEFIEYNGQIEWISSEAEFTPKIIQTKEERISMVYAIKVRIKNDGKIKLGMPGEVKFN